jgi:transcriptional regulator with PAS, ATPase and Fis domain
VTASTATLTLVRHGRRDWLRLPGLRLVVRGPSGATAGAALGLSPLVVGSGRGADVRVGDGTVSARHCEVRLTEGGVVVRDLGSKNGLVLAGVRLREAVLAPGARVALGRSSLGVVEDGPPREVPLWPEPRFGEAVGAGPAMRALFATLHRAAAGADTVLLRGESGTGKELLARAVHAASPRRDGPFVVFDCGAVAPGLVEAELFGVEKGAYTGAERSRPGVVQEAAGGTLFLDEVGELPLELQPRLLRLLEQREVRPVGASRPVPVDVRVVAATHRPLGAQVRAGAFRQDLYYRLAVLEVHVPPLRERPEDVPLLAERILAGLSPPRTLEDLPPHALDMLRAHAWPGNVRELRNAVLRLALFPALTSLAPGAELHAASAYGGAPEGGGARPAAPALPLREAREAVVREFERRYVREQLAAAGGNVSAAARRMGISRQLLHRMLAELGVRPPRR